METIGLFFKTLWSPGEAMFFLSKKPRILVPLILIGVLQLGVGLVGYAKLDYGQIVLKQLEKSPQGRNMTDEQKQNAAQIYRRFAPAFPILGAVTPPIFITVAAALYFGIFTVLGRNGSFKAFYAVTLFAYIPLLIRQAASVVQIFTVPPEQLDINELGNLSVSVFLDPSSVSKVVYALSTVVDLTSIWIMILLVIGYKFLTTKSVGTGLRTAAVIIPYLFFSLILAGLRMLQMG
ncbi:MAG TPA: YIP1 family protein [Terriglobia bacterium]|nr:YIP1 family protein [Terriglobia bacterium]